MAKTVTFGEICDVIKGISYRSTNYTDSKHGEAFINLKCVGLGGGFRMDGIKYYKGGKKPEQTVEAGDILIANTDLTQNREVIGSPMIMPDIGRPACFSLDLSKLVKKSNDVDMCWLYYYLKSPVARNYMISHSNGSTVMHLSVKAVPKMKINLPDLLKQKRIAEILGDLDAKIDLNREIIKNLEPLASAIFTQTFTNNPNREKWPIAKLTDIVNVKYGKNLPTKKLLADGYPVFGGNGLIGYFDKYMYEKQMVLVACRGAASGKVNVSSEKSFVTNNSLILEPKDDVSFEFLKYFSLERGGYYDFVTGSAQPQITVESMSKCSLLLPPNELIKQFTAEAAPITEYIKFLTTEIQTLITTRDYLLPRLIDGRVN